jgi:hypothetical protein
MDKQSELAVLWPVEDRPSEPAGWLDVAFWSAADPLDEAFLSAAGRLALVFLSAAGWSVEGWLQSAVELARHL